MVESLVVMEEKVVGEVMVEGLKPDLRNLDAILYMFFFRLTPKK